MQPFDQAWMAQNAAFPGMGCGSLEKRQQRRHRSTDIRVTLRACTFQERRVHSGYTSQEFFGLRRRATWHAKQTMHNGGGLDIGLSSTTRSDCEYRTSAAMIVTRRPRLS